MAKAWIVGAKKIADLDYATLCRKTRPRNSRRTADPSASLGMTKERAAVPQKWLQDRGVAAHPTWRKTDRSANHPLCDLWSFLCHPERSRGICSSTAVSWKCFSTERGCREIVRLNLQLIL